MAAAPDTVRSRLHALDRRLRAFGPGVGANRAFLAAIAAAIVLLVVVGRDQWFIRDDWGILLTRQKMSEGGDAVDAYLLAKDGHWMTVPIALYLLLDSWFGLDSYWPYLVLCQLTHLGIVVAIRITCQRVGAAPWTATLVCSALLVLGSGWENLVFAVQITYNLSLLAFLVHLLLVDHDGPVGRRDVAGAVVALVGLASSGFGPFFVAGVVLLLVLRRRWTAALLAAGPGAVVFAVWWLAFGSDRAAESYGRPVSRVPEFISIGLTATFEALTPVGTLIGISMLATTAVLVWRARDPRAHDLLVALSVTMIVIFLGIGIQRVGLGVGLAASSRYVYVSAVLIAPAFAVAVDQLARIGRPAMLAGWLALAAAAGMQAAQLYVKADDWAARADDERHRLELIAGSTLPDGFDVAQACLDFSPDVRCADVPRLVTEGAIVPRAPETDADRAFVDRLALGDVTP